MMILPLTAVKYVVCAPLTIIFVDPVMSPLAVVSLSSCTSTEVRLDGPLL